GAAAGALCRGAGWRGLSRRRRPAGAVIVLPQIRHFPVAVRGQDAGVQVVLRAPMPKLEQRLQQRYPDWFRGRRGRVAAPLLRGVARWSRFDAIDGFLAEHAHLRGFEFVAAALRHLQVRYEADDGAAGRIPATGRLLIVAN